MQPYQRMTAKELHQTDSAAVAATAAKLNFQTRKSSMEQEISEQTFSPIQYSRRNNA